MRDIFLAPLSFLLYPRDVRVAQQLGGWLCVQHALMATAGTNDSQAGSFCYIPNLLELYMYMEERA